MADYYVATATSGFGASDSNTGLAPAWTSGTNGPWLTLAKATGSSGVPTTGGPHTCYLRGGTWNSIFTLSGKTFANKVTFKNYPGETPIINGSTLVAGDYPDYEHHLVSVRYTPNVRLEGLTATRADQGDGIYIFTDSHYCEVVNCKTSYSRLAGIHVANAHDVLIDGNEVTRANDATYAVGGVSAEIISIDFPNCYNVEVCNNWCHNFRPGTPGGGEGINVKNGAHDIWVHDNVVDNMREDSTRGDKPCLSYDGWGQHTYNVYFWNNVALNSAMAGHYPNNEETASSVTENCYFWNNIVYNCERGVIMPPYSEGRQGQLYNCYIWNNTFYNCNTAIRAYRDNNTGYIYIQNNLFANCGPNSISAAMLPYLVMDHNYYGTGANFQNAATQDYRLTASTPSGTGGIVGQGCTDLVVSGLPVRFNPATYDAAAGSVANLHGGIPFTKTAVARGASWDLGAYEYTGSTPPVGTPVLSVR